MMRKVIESIEELKLGPLAPRFECPDCGMTENRVFEVCCLHRLEEGATVLCFKCLEPLVFDGVRGGRKLSEDVLVDLVFDPKYRFADVRKQIIYVEKRGKVDPRSYSVMTVECLAGQAEAVSNFMQLTQDLSGAIGAPVELLKDELLVQLKQRKNVSWCSWESVVWHIKKEATWLAVMARLAQQRPKKAVD